MDTQETWLSQGARTSTFPFSVTSSIARSKEVIYFFLAVGLIARMGCRPLRSKYDLDSNYRTFKLARRTAR